MEEKTFLEKNAGGANQKIPNQKELERELSDYLSKKYGDRVKIVTPFVFPKGEPEERTSLTLKRSCRLQAPF